ncbi:MAG TPA: hypothetical protein VFG10_09465 [Saprospiraceae bacterium]|nr:hypothetical protein [Saprospiraceae bacterium]
MFSFVTNATLNDAVRLDVFIPHVLKVFDSHIDELLIVIDAKTEEGRIKHLHATDIINPKINDAYISRIQALDYRIRFIKCDYSEVKVISPKWFNKKNINRCQAGTPIFAFLFGIEHCKNEKIIRSDCDILFFDKGFIDRLWNDNNHEMIQLPRLNNTWNSFSSRSFYIDRRKMEMKLPLTAYKLNLIRQLHRFLKKRPPYLALEQMLDAAIRKDKFNFEKCSTASGYTMHIAKREEFRNIIIHEVERKFRQGFIPPQQLNYNHDYKEEAWIDFT